MEGTEMLYYRRMLRLRWTKRVTNETAISNMGTIIHIHIIRKRQLKVFGNIMEGFLRTSNLQSIYSGPDRQRKAARHLTGELVLLDSETG